jgi:hypothetical protein
MGEETPGAEHMSLLNMKRDASSSDLHGIPVPVSLLNFALLWMSGRSDAPRPALCKAASRLTRGFGGLSKQKGWDRLRA